MTFVSHKAEYLAALNTATKAALEKCGAAAERHAKELCPVDTGRLRNSIGHSLNGDAVTIGANTDYAAFVELGTHRMRAQPYIRPAAENYAEEYKTYMTQALKNA